MTKKLIFIVILNLFSTILLAENNRYYSFDKGLVSLIYHRFNESKYPSTNIQMDIFTKQISIINENNYNYFNPNKLDIFFEKPDKQKKILITIDDAFSSFYENAWPYLKENKIPFILFVSTEPIGKYGYMNWDQIREIEKEDFVLIGNHSHSHEYLVNFTFEDFKKDIDASIKIFKKELGYNPIFFSYPFGEYSLEHKNYIKQKFKYAFGQHSGVIDLTKDKFELPRFPINEKYGELKRFSSIINYFPLPYKKLSPENKLVKGNDNPPIVEVEFFKDQENIKRINCFSNEGDECGNPKIEFNENKMTVKFRDKFKFRRGRLNCSLNDEGKWRWFGAQFIIKED